VARQGKGYILVVPTFFKGVTNVAIDKKFPNRNGTTQNLGNFFLIISSQKKAKKFVTSGKY
jgi:hypothetical protein